MEKFVQVPVWHSHKTIFIYTALVLFAISVKLIYCQLKWISNILPESCVFILIGCTLNYLFSQASSTWKQLKPEFTIDGFFLFLLPPIMLESAYSLNSSLFYLNIGPILVYAIIGTVINIATIGPSLYIALERLNANIQLRQFISLPEVSLLELMIFGTSLSAIDPVAVLALFKDVKVHRALYYLVFGESLLNDAVVIVIHKILFNILRTNEPLTAELLWMGLIRFVIVGLGSTLNGFLFGVLTSLATLTTRHMRDIEPMLVLALAYAAYITAEIFEWSGVISIIVCGLMQAQYAFHNVCTSSRITIKEYIVALSATSDVIIFMFIGVILVETEHHWNITFIALTTLFCLIYRALSVASLTFVINKTIKATFNIELREQLLMVHAGLRGAIAYVLILTLNNPEQHIDVQSCNTTSLDQPSPHNLSSSIQWTTTLNQMITANDTNGTSGMHNHDPVVLLGISTFHLLQSTTLFIILATVFILGSTTRPLLKFLDIKREAIDDAGKSLFTKLNEQLLDEVNLSVKALICGHQSRVSCWHKLFAWLQINVLQRFLISESTMIYDNMAEEPEDDDDDHNKQRGDLGARIAKQHARDLSTFELIIRQHIARQLNARAKRALHCANRQKNEDEQENEEEEALSNNKRSENNLPSHADSGDPHARHRLRMARIFANETQATSQEPNEAELMSKREEQRRTRTRRQERSSSRSSGSDARRDTNIPSGMSHTQKPNPMDANCQVQQHKQLRDNELGRCFQALRKVVLIVLACFGMHNTPREIASPPSLERPFVHVIENNNSTTRTWGDDGNHGQQLRSNPANRRVWQHHANSTTTTGTSLSGFTSSSSQVNAPGGRTYTLPSSTSVHLPSVEDVSSLGSRHTQPVTIAAWRYAFLSPVSNRPTPSDRSSLPSIYSSARPSNAP